MRAGKFDNLRGQGKPLDATPEPHVPPEMQMANSLLKNNELTPAWIGDRNAVLGEIERFRSKVRRAVLEHRAAVDGARHPTARAAIEQRWQTQLASWRDEVQRLNRRIEMQNFRQPVSFLEIVKVRLEDEISRV